MNKVEIERLYVVKPFKIYLKKKAAENDMSMIEFTDTFMKQKDPLNSLEIKRRKFKFDFV